MERSLVNRTPGGVVAQAGDCDEGDENVSVRYRPRRTKRAKSSGEQLWLSWAP